MLFLVVGWLLLLTMASVNYSSSKIAKSAFLVAKKMPTGVFAHNLHFILYELHFGQNPVTGLWAHNPVLNDKARVHGKKSSCSSRV
jgi:hypothetical protein